MVHEKQAQDTKFREEVDRALRWVRKNGSGGGDSKGGFELVGLLLDGFTSDVINEVERQLKSKLSETDAKAE